MSDALDGLEAALQSALSIAGTVHWVRPLWLLALLPALLVLAALIARGGRGASWRGVCDEHLLAHLLDAPRRHLRWGVMGLLAAWIAVIVALAGPAWQERPTPVFDQPWPRLILLDLSRSMAATDIKPSRIEQAKFKLRDLLATARDGHWGLMVYSDHPYVVTPLSRDTETVATLIPPLAPDLMPSQGSRLDRALAKAGTLFVDSGATGGDIIVVTDEVRPVDSALETVRELAERRLRVSVYAVASDRGGPIPDDDGEGFMRDVRGRIVLTRLDREGLQRLAQVGRGAYVEHTADRRDLERLVLATTPDPNVEAAETDLTTRRWREEGPWILLFLLPFAALVFRRGVLASAVLAVGVALAPTEPARANWWDDLWQRPDQQAYARLPDAPEAAARMFEDPAWKGIAHYRAGEFEEALAAFNALAPTADALYNQGNALAKLERFEEALNAYDRALERAPEHADARHNRDLVAQALSARQGQQRQGSGDNQTTGAGDDKANPSQRQASGQQPDASGQNRQPEPDAQPGDPSARPNEGQARGEGEPAEPQAETPAERQPRGTTDQGDGEGDPVAEEPELPDPDARRQAEADQALEQLLRQLEDDPGGLLRSKLYLHYRRNYNLSPREDAQW